MPPFGFLLLFGLAVLCVLFAHCMYRMSGICDK